MYGSTTTDTTSGYSRIVITNSVTMGTGSTSYGYGFGGYNHDRGEYAATLPARWSEVRSRFERLARADRRLAARIEAAIAQIERFEESRKLAVDVRRRDVAAADPSQLELAPRPLARRHARQSVPSRTRRRLRTWER